MFKITSVRIAEEDLKYCKNNQYSLGFVLKTGILSLKSGLSPALLSDNAVKNVVQLGEKIDRYITFLAEITAKVEKLEEKTQILANPFARMDNEKYTKVEK